MTPSPRRFSRLLRSFGVFVAVAIAGLALAGPASAHATLLTSSPVAGSRVNVEPRSVTLHFDEVIGVIPAAEQVLSSTGTRADDGHVSQTDSGKTLVLQLKSGLPKGTYTAVWRVVSADSHVVSGSVTFGLGVEPGAGVSETADHSSALAATDQIAQGLVYAGVVLFVGLLGACLILWPWAARTRRVVVAAALGWGLLFLGTAMQLLLQGPRADNAGWSGFFAVKGLSQTLDSTYGKQLLARLALLLLDGALASRPRSRQPENTNGGRLFAGLAGAAVLISVAVTGHASVGPAVALALPAAVLHIAGMALWLGGLAVLALAVLPGLRQGSVTFEKARLRRWSAVAYSSVVLLVVTGEYLASRQISPIQALWTTRYGLILLIKVGLVAAMLGAAYLANRGLMRPAETEPEAAPEDFDAPPMHAGSGGVAVLSRPATSVRPSPTLLIARRLTRSVVIEATVAVLVLATTALLVSQQPARTSYGPAVTMTAPLGPDQARIAINSTRRGQQNIRITVLDVTGVAIPVQSVTAKLSSPSVGDLDVTLHQSPGVGTDWVSSNAVAPLPGLWTITLDVNLGTFDDYATSATYRVW